MRIEQAIRLIDYPGISVPQPTVWADFGAGTGVFTSALASLLAPGSRIIAVDQDSASLRKINCPATVMLDRKVGDFTKIDPGPDLLDGLLMANALHFVKDKDSFLKRISAFMANPATIVIVEYDMNRPNPWVPYPVSYDELDKIVESSLGINIHKIGEIPSVYNRGMIYGSFARLGNH